MIILLLILSILTTALSFWFVAKDDCETYTAFMIGDITGVVGCLMTLVMIIVTAHYTNDVVSLRYIDEKIAMYQEENDNIEVQIDTLVQNYMQYEQTTFSEFKNEDAMTLVSLYPELKSDTLVQSQISVYTENNQKIKELKAKKIDLAVSKWWLYFGK